MKSVYRVLLFAIVMNFVVSAQPVRLAPTPGRPVGVGPHGKSAIEVDVNGAFILSGASQIQIDLPGGHSVIAERLQHQSRGATSAFWRGKLTFEPTSDVTLTWHKGFLAGAIRRAGGVFEIRPSRGGAVIEELNMGSFPACGGAVQPRPNFAADARTEVPSSDLGAAVPEAVIEIALLSVYTPQARDAAGGVSQIEAQIQAAVDNANLAFQNSQVAATYTLAHTALANYNDSGSASSDLNWVASDPAVAALRNQYGADMVSLITSNGGGACGIGYVMRSVSSSFAPYAFQVTDRDCAVGNLTFAHEHGHNSGLEHDPANGTSPSSASYPWSFGHFVNGQFRTVMSYATPCSSPCTRVAHYSNPSVTYLGYATGIAEQRDNARTLRSTTPVVAAFRGVAPGTPPDAPSLLSATPISASQINLSWTDGSTDESGFRIERSANAGASYAEVATVGANVTSWSNTGLLSNTTYIYRVRAYNAAGNSAYTNTASATTLSGPPAAPASISGTPVFGGSGKTKTLLRINVSWTDSPNESTYELERCTVVTSRGSETCSMALVTQPTLDTTTFPDPVTVKATYRYRIRSVNGSGFSAWTVSANVNAK